MSEAKTQTTPKSDSAGVDPKAIGEAIAEGIAMANYDPLREERRKNDDRREQLSADFRKNGKINVPYSVSYKIGEIEYTGTWDVSPRILDSKSDEDHTIANGTFIALGLKSHNEGPAKGYSHTATALSLSAQVLAKNSQSKLDDLAPMLGYSAIVPLYTGDNTKSKFKERVNKDVKLTKPKA